MQQTISWHRRSAHSLTMCCAMGSEGPVMLLLPDAATTLSWLEEALSRGWVTMPTVTGTNQGEGCEHG